MIETPHTRPGLLPGRDEARAELPQKRRRYPKMIANPQLFVLDPRNPQNTRPEYFPIPSERPDEPLSPDIEFDDPRLVEATAALLSRADQIFVSVYGPATARGLTLPYFGNVCPHFRRPPVTLNELTATARRFLHAIDWISKRLEHRARFWKGEKLRPTWDQPILTLWRLARALRPQGVNVPTGPSVDSPVTAYDAVAELISWCEQNIQTPAADQATPPKPNPSVRVSPGKGKRKHVNEQMILLLAEDQERIWWTAEQWAERLKCKASSVKETKTWKETIMMFRAVFKAERTSKHRLRR